MHSPKKSCLAWTLLTLMLAAWTTHGTAIGEAEQVALSANDSSPSTLSISQVIVPSKPIGVYQKLELQFQINGTYKNPYDPADVYVDAEIVLPDGREISVPAFYSEPYRSTRNGEAWLEGGVPYERIGNSRWMARYTPTTPGLHRIRLVAATPKLGERQAEQTVSDWFNVEVVPASGKGFVQQSATNPLYLENSGDGTLFYPVGVNIAWTRSGDRNLGRPDGSMEYYLNKAAGNMTATRVWMCHFAWLEWTSWDSQPTNNSWRGYGGLGRYNQMVASAFDQVFELAEQQGLRIMLTLDDNDEHSTTGTGRAVWAYNPYNVVNGGPCQTPQCVFSDPKARQAYKNRLRYIMARWGYSASLWALNTWNDYASSAPNKAQLEWLNEMRDYVHSISDGVRPVFFGTNFRFGAQAISDYAQVEQGGLVQGKPNVEQEVYYTSDSNWFLNTLQYELWNKVTRGAGGVMVWPHHIVDKLGAWSPVFKNVTNVLEAIPLNHKDFQPVQVQVKSATLGAADPNADPNMNPQRVLQTVTVNRYGDVPDFGAKAPRDTWDVDAQGGNQFLMGLGAKLYGERPDRVGWRTTPTFNIDLPNSGQMMVRIMEISGSVNIRVRDKGAVIVDQPYTGSGRWTPSGTGKYLIVPLSAGKHTLSLSIDGGVDWVQLGEIHFVYELPDASQALCVQGLSSGEEAVLYVWNPTYGEVYQKVVQGKAQDFSGVQIDVAGFVPGSYMVEVYDLDTGRIMSQSKTSATQGAVTVAIPRLRRDAAIRIYGVPSSTD